MKKYRIGLIFILLLFLLTACGAAEGKTSNFSAIYGVTAVLASVLLVAYCCAVKKKDPWFLLLFSAVMVVNIGYFSLAVSKNLDEALLANRLSYLGSVFLPLSMWMIILNISRIPYRKWLPALLVGLGVVVFLIAASPGYLPIYYKEVYYQQVNGVTVLQKVYGPLHSLYMVYLIGYFAAMIIAIVYAAAKNTIESIGYAAILAIAVFVNIGVWLIEQLVQINFELLSVSYIITECFLLGLHLFIAELQRRTPAEAPVQVPQDDIVACQEVSELPPAELEVFAAGLALLTPKEQSIYEMYLQGLSTAQVLEQLHIKENTLKFHNKNIYGKLGVTSRKQLLHLAALIPGTSVGKE